MSTKRKVTDGSSSESHNKKSKTTPDESKLDKTQSEINTNATTGTNIFKDLSFYILQPGIEKARINIFKKQIVQNGGHLEESFAQNSTLSYIITDDKMEVDRMLRLLGLVDFPKSTTVVKTGWLSICLKSKKLLASDNYLLKPEASHQMHANIVSTSSQSYDTTRDHAKKEQTDMSPSTIGMKEISHLHNRHHKADNDFSDDSDYEASGDEDTRGEQGSELDLEFGPLTKKIPVDKWICAQSSKNPMPNHNKHITDKLEEMVKAYNSTNDKWRSYGYQKCIRALMRHPNKISSWEEAKALPGVGGRLADKIWEIAESGDLRKLNAFKSSEEIRIMSLFNDVWGAGPHTAQTWYQQGFRSIEDLRTKAKLTSQQKVGVRLYDDLIERMPREEAGQIAKVVKDAAESIQPGLIAQACGSYRRGKVTCGDVDVLVTHPDGKSHKGVFGKLLDKLHQTGFLTDDLVSSEDNGNQKKYLGVCKLPGDNTKHRRLDIIVVPYHEYACAVMYFTGSAHFNRSLRLLCKRQDMSLSEHALRYGVIRQGGERVHEGTIIPTPTEESVFKVLKIPYRPPEERDH